MDTLHTSAPSCAVCTFIWTKDCQKSLPNSTPVFHLHTILARGHPDLASQHTFASSSSLASRPPSRSDSPTASPRLVLSPSFGRRVSWSSPGYVCLLLHHSHSSACIHFPHADVLPQKSILAITSSPISSSYAKIICTHTQTSAKGTLHSTPHLTSHPKGLAKTHLPRTLM